MNARDRMILGLVASLGVMGAMWFVLVAPKRDDATALKADIAQAAQRRDTATSSVAVAEQAKARYRRDYATVARLGKAVPADDDVASLVYQLESVARHHKVDFRSVALTAPAAAPAPAPVPAPAPSGSDKGAAPAAATPPPGAVVGTAGLTTMPFKFVFEGSYLKLQRFLHAMDGLTTAERSKISVRGRLLTVDGFNLGAGRKGLPQIRAEVTATAYIVPQAEGLLAGATPQGPAGSVPSSPPGGAAPTAAPTTTASVGGNG